jgi:anhydro-N-acetylmuramic acid kinase
MSGTSLDGLDIACCHFQEEAGKWSFNLLAADCIDYSAEWQERLQQAHTLSGIELIRLDVEYGKFIGDQVQDFIGKHDLRPSLIASHGHTVFHEPENNLSLQIGSGAAICAATSLPVISEFRSLDVALGGQGAPLVPAGDRLLFGEYDLCLNLGGVANISYEKESERLAFDISPCNLILNCLAAEKGALYDKNGDLARTGKVDAGLLQELNEWYYYRVPAPKSLDKERLLSEVMPLFNKNSLSSEDKLATACLHIAEQIGKVIKMAAPAERSRMLVTGGGAFNSWLVHCIEESSPAEIVVPDQETIAFKEAIVFAFLGLMRALNVSNSFSSVTGARHDNIGGALHGDYSAFCRQ